MDALNAAKEALGMDEAHRIGAIDAGISLYLGSMVDVEHQAAMNAAMYHLCDGLNLDPAQAAGMLSALGLPDWTGASLYRAVPAAYLLGQDPTADGAAIVARLVALHDELRPLPNDEAHRRVAAMFGPFCYPFFYELQKAQGATFPPRGTPPRADRC